MNDNSPLAVDTGRGLIINYQGKNLYSQYNPVKTPETIAETAVLHEETLYIVPSPLLLYGIEKLLYRLPETSFILAIEIDQKLMKISMNHIKPINNSQFHYVRLDSREQIKMIIEDLGTERFRRCQLLPINNGYNLYKEKYDYLYNFASFLLSTFWRNRLTINKLGNLWIKNILLNAQKVSSRCPDNNGKPIIICGAGASLEQSLSLLKRNRESVYIMAVDTALTPLLDSNIIPDIVFALEAQFYNLGDFYNLKNHKIDLLTDITGYPPVCRKMNGETYFFISDFFENSLLRRLKEKNIVSITIPPLGSVGVAAVYTAIQIFDTDIFLTGLDFSFVPGKSHTKGSPFTNSLLRSSSRFIPAGSYKSAMNRAILTLPGKNPQLTISTDAVLNSYAKLLIDIISQENRIFDLSTTGYPLGAEYVDEVSFKKLLTKKLKKENISPGDLPTKSDLRKFLKNEKFLLNKLIGEWDDFDKSMLENIPESLMGSLNDVDYVYIDFPDRLPHPQKDVSFVSRAVISARKYVELITRVL